jgi:hypothetical protein
MICWESDSLAAERKYLISVNFYHIKCKELFVAEEKN